MKSLTTKVSGICGLLAAMLTIVSCKKQNTSTEEALSSLSKSKTEKMSLLSGSTYYIPKGTIADHADPTVPNSIAWYFATYGAGNTYILSTSGSYYTLNSMLTVPENSIFQGNSTTETDWKLAANTGLDDGVMIKLSNGSTLKNLYIYGFRRPSVIVNLSSTTDATVSNCVIFNSKNNYPAGSTGKYSILIHAFYSTNATIESCVLRRAGSGPKVNATSEPYGYAIRMGGSVNPVVQNNDIASTLTCGIDFTGSSNVMISGNAIDSTGLNRFTAGPIADGITAYHNLNPIQERYAILNNTITNAQNHGIHVSGLNINVQGNTITGQKLSGIMIYDQRIPTEYSSNITVMNNKVGNPTIANPFSNRAIYMNYVDNTQNLNYQNNKLPNGTAMPVTSAYYRFPTDFGPH